MAFNSQICLDTHWQSDITQWRFANGQDVEISNWLDDHSRALLSITVYDRVTGVNVMDTFTDNINE
jgi:hypothetical protein